MNVAATSQVNQCCRGGPQMMVNMKSDGSYGYWIVLLQIRINQRQYTHLYGHFQNGKILARKSSAAQQHKYVQNCNRKARKSNEAKTTWHPTIVVVWKRTQSWKKKRLEANQDNSITPNTNAIEIKPCHFNRHSWYHIVKDVVSRRLILYFGDPFCRPNVCIMYFCCKLKTRQGLPKMCLQGTDHDKHQSLRIATQREL